MQRQIVETADGSHSLFVPALNEQYHSRHGAIQESRHVFIEKGLRAIISQNDPISILEIGFGTGLNAFLTALEARKLKISVEYWGVEAFPLTATETASLNYPQEVGEMDANEIWDRIHTSPLNRMTQILPLFQLCKIIDTIEKFNLQAKVDLIYFDAFAPDTQPELWTVQIFQKMFSLLKHKGILTTYCAKGLVRRTMQEVGFTVKRESGPPGKREMLVAQKP